jgi:hypothetical protein
MRRAQPRCAVRPTTTGFFACRARGRALAVFFGSSRRGPRQTVNPCDGRAEALESVGEFTKNYRERNQQQLAAWASPLRLTLKAWFQSARPYFATLRVVVLVVEIAGRSKALLAGVHFSLLWGGGGVVTLFLCPGNWPLMSADKQR